MPGPEERRLLRLMLALTFSTGVIDAVGYLGLDRVFTGNMTGNVVILAMAITGAAGLPIAGPALALAGFVTGAAAAGRVLRRDPTGWHRRTTFLFAGVALALAVVAAYLLLDEHPARPGALVVTAALGTAMGTQAGTARQVAVRDVSTVVVTSTLAGLAADSAFGSGAGAQAGAPGGAVLLIMAGAATGALLLRWHLGAGVLLSATLTTAVAWLGHRGLETPVKPVPETIGS